ncbi:MAG: YciI family protein [Chloroflexota bacterium]
MRFMVLVPGNEEFEAGQLPPPELVARMTKYNEELVKAGVMLDGNGLRPTAHAARVKFNGATRTVVDGPFAESKELVAGYWIWECKSMQEAIEWLKRAPFDGGVTIDIRQIQELDDFAPIDPTGELRAAEQQVFSQLGGR